MDSRPSLVAFGALAPWPASGWQQHLKNALQNKESLKPLLAAIFDLQCIWDVLAVQDPRLEHGLGRRDAEQWAAWASAPSHEVLDERHNALTVPMTVITHIVQYLDYLESTGGTLPHDSVIKTVGSKGGIQGFCIGLLSALAVASAQDEQDLGKFAANSFKLAFCVGVYIDHTQSVGCGFSSLVVRWQVPSSLEDLQSLLRQYPDVSIA
jgi:hypothetical protein